MKTLHRRHHLYCLLLVISASGHLHGCSMKRLDDFREEIDQQAAQINTEDGISKKEAIVLAQRYVLTHIYPSLPEGLGIDLRHAFVRGDKLHENCWRVYFLSSFRTILVTKLPIYGVSLNKTTGVIVSSGPEPS